MLVRIVIECEISGVDEENMQAEIETATLTWETPIIRDIRLVDWKEREEAYKAAHLENFRLVKQIAVLEGEIERLQVELLQALQKLANEADGFMHLASAYTSIFGVTNVEVLRRRIEEARSAIAKVEER